jgi:class 3 adenylate cyclase
MSVQIEKSLEQRLVAIETTLAELQERLKESSMASELRFRRIWKQDIEAAHRGHLQDVLTHVEARVDNLAHAQVRSMGEDVRARLNRHDARVSEIVAAAKEELEHKVANIVVVILAEYGVKSRENQPIKYQ